MIFRNYNLESLSDPRLRYWRCVRSTFCKNDKVNPSRWLYHAITKKDQYSRPFQRERIGTSLDFVAFFCETCDVS
jgi:hypothetical protein